MDLTPFSLQNKKALVTGGGRGIGKACARALAQAGAQVTVVSRTQEQLDQTVRDIEDRGGTARAIVGDLGQADFIGHLVETVFEEEGQVDILVNNAAISPIFKRAQKVTMEEWEEIVGVNLNRTFHLLRDIGSRMVERRSGAVINITSIGAERALARLSAYAATKAALGELTRTLAVEWAEAGVRVNAVAPAYIETVMTADIQKNDHLRQQVINRTPLGRFGEPSEVGWAVVFLASQAASYITGHTLFVDGGWTSL